MQCVNFGRLGHIEWTVIKHATKIVKKYVFAIMCEPLCVPKLFFPSGYIMYERRPIKILSQNPWFLLPWEV